MYDPRTRNYPTAADLSMEAAMNRLAAAGRDQASETAPCPTPAPEGSTTAISGDLSREEAVRRLVEAEDRCSEILGYVQAGQSDPHLYDMVRDLLFTIDGRAAQRDEQDAQRDELATDTAEYIADVLVPRSAGLVINPDDLNATEIKTWLLDGRLRMSWMDDRVMTAMRALHPNATEPSF